MTVALIVLAFRLFIPFTIFRWPLLGGVFAFAADFYDFFLLNTFGWGFLTSETYQSVDKVFDIYYLSFEFIVALRWSDVLAKKAAGTLYFWRLAGVILFELTGIRKILLLTPNIFEYFYFIFLAIKKRKPQFQLTRKTLLLMVVLIGIPKTIQEFIMHYLEYPLGVGTLWRLLVK